MTLNELIVNWIENDRTGEYCREITIDDAAALVGYMDPDVLENIGGKPSPQAFMDAWNSVIREFPHYTIDIHPKAPAEPEGSDSNG